MECRVKNLPDGKRLVHSVGVWAVWCGEASGSAAGDGAPLDERLDLTWGPRCTSASGGRSAAAYCTSGWVMVCPVAGRRGFCLDVVLRSFLLDMSWTVSPLRMNCLSLVRWLLLYMSLLVSPLCHWLVGRADGRGFRKVVPFVRGRFLCLWK